MANQNLRTDEYAAVLVGVGLPQEVAAIHADGDRGSMPETCSSRLGISSCSSAV